MRVPRGAPSLLMITPAFSPNRMYDPSSLRVSFFVLTTTALTTSPLRTPPPGAASLTVATTTSPTPALRLLEPPGTRMVGYPDSCLVLYHYCSALDTTFASRHRLRAERGRVSIIRTVSPTRASFCSSCTIKRLDRLTRFLYNGCCTSASTETTTVFSGLSETTRPTRSLRLPRVGSLCTEPSS